MGVSVAPDAKAGRRRRRRRRVAVVIAGCVGQARSKWETAVRLDTTGGRCGPCTRPTNTKKNVGKCHQTHLPRCHRTGLPRCVLACPPPTRTHAHARSPHTHVHAFRVATVLCVCQISYIAKQNIEARGQQHLLGKWRRRFCESSGR